VAQRRLSKIAAGLLLGMLLLNSRSARADERTEARGHFKKGMAAIADGRYDAGIEELKSAYEILPHPNVLYNIARAYVDMGDLENAVVYYKKYLEGGPKDRDEVAQIIASLEDRTRKQQAMLLETQQAQTPAGGPGAAGPAGVGPGAGSLPGGATAGTPGAVSPGPGGQLAEGPGTSPGSLKTEDLFEETVITASKTAQSPLDAPSSTSIITEQDIRLSGITQIPELLRRLAGVDIMETTGSQTEVSMRGFNQRLSNKVLVLIDGRSFYVDLLGSTIWSTLPVGVEDIERIEVVRGPGSALYGADAFNGVVNIITKAPGKGPNGVNVGYGSHDFGHASIWSTGTIGESSFRLSAGYDNVPRWDREDPPGRTDLITTVANQNVSGAGGRLAAEITRHLGKDVNSGIFLGYNNGQTEILAEGSLNDDIIVGSSTQLAAWANSKHFEIRSFWTNTQGSSGGNATTIGQSLLPSLYNTNVVDVESQYIDEFETGRGIVHDLHLGAEYRLKEVNWTYLDKEETENHFGLFVHDEVKIGRRFAVVADYRADYVPYLARIVQSPRGSVLFHPSDKSTVRGIVATAFRTPNFLESYIGLPVQLPAEGGSLSSPAVPPKIQPEQIFTTELGYLNSESDYFTFDSAFFYNHANNLIEVRPNTPISVGELSDPQLGAGLNPSTGTYPLFLGGFENQCQRYNVYGAELGVRTYPVEGLDFYANYTLMKVDQDNTECSAAQLALLANDARTSTHKLNAGVQLRTKMGIDGEVDVHFVSPQDWAEQISDVQKQEIIYQSFHLDAYTLVNARVGYRFLHNQAEVSGVAFNLLDDQHREHPFGQIIDRRLMGFFTYRF
jgi:outer membrane receptor for ferrienterochelin and colicin